jgi:hypothetical protein
MTRLSGRIAHLVLLFAGFTLGLIGITVYEKVAPVAEVKGSLAMNACVDTKTANDDIFFLSCGGIY